MWRSQKRSVLSRYCGRLALACALFVMPGAGAAQDGSLEIELNKLENTDEGCRSLFVFDNRTGHELHRFRIDLILFDPKGVYKKQLLLDMAPLEDEKKTLASFLLGEWPCDQVGSILINGLPQCDNGAGEAVECTDMLEVGSRSEVPLEK
jgi:hypothetical protein